MNLYDLKPDEKTILEYILVSNCPTVKDILKALYSSDEKKKWHLYRKLKKLETRGFIKATFLEELKGASSEKYFTLRAKGAHVLGLEKVPPGHYNTTVTKEYQVFRLLKVNLSFLAKEKRWTLLTENKICRKAVASFFKIQAERRGDPIAPTYVYLDAVPQKITPDMILATGREIFIVIISHPSAKGEAFRKKLEKYQGIISNIRFICLNPTEEQTTLYLQIIRHLDKEQERRIAQQFLILSYSQLDSLPSFLR